MAAVTQANQLVERVVARVGELYADEASVVLYGSMVRGDWQAGRSDVNLLVVAPGVSMADLCRLTPEFRGFEAERSAPPFLITRSEWVRAADAFPIEITDMRQAYRVLRGSDPLAGLEVRAADLRHALEAEFRGKLLRLRADYALYADQPRLLAAVVGASIGSLRVLFRGLVVITGHGAAPDDAGLAALVAPLLGAQKATVADLLGRRRQHAWDCPAAHFESYLGLVEQAVRVVDTFTPGAT